MSSVIDENSCIEVINREIELGLMPKYMGSEERAITKILDSWRSKYNYELKGILLNYSHVKFVSDFGRIIDDQPFIYWTINADFHVFNVSKGQLIKSKINRIGHKYVGSLVGNCIDATIILSDENIPQEELTPFLKIDQEIIFCVNNFDANHSFIDGIINEECFDKMKQFIQLNEFDESYASGSFFT